MHLGAAITASAVPLPSAIQAARSLTCYCTGWQPPVVPSLRSQSRLRASPQPLPAIFNLLYPCPADVSDNQLLAAAGVAVGGTTRVALSLAEGSSLRGNQAFLAGLLLGGGDGDLSVQLAASNDTDNGVVLVGAARASPRGL